jgi:hypothetical protein
MGRETTPGVLAETHATSAHVRLSHLLDRDPAPFADEFPADAD